MPENKQFEDRTLLRIFLGEADTLDGISVYERIIREAKEKGIAGATVIRGIAGYGRSGKIHTARIMELSSDLPVIVELIDSEERLKKIFPFLTTLSGITITLEKIRILHP